MRRWCEDYSRRDETDNRKRKPPPERGAGAALGAVLLGPHKAPLVPPAIHTAQHERAGRAESRGARPALPLVCPCRSSPAATAILHGLARRIALQTQALPPGSRASRWPGAVSFVKRPIDIGGAVWALSMQIRGPARDVRGHLNAGPSYLTASRGMQDEALSVKALRVG